MKAMHPHRVRRLMAVAAIVLGSSTAVALVLYALNQNINLFYSTSQIATGEAPMNHMIRLGGMVVEGSVSRDPETLRVSFDLTDYGEAVTVQFQGILPDLFREGQGIVARGKLVGDRLLVAEEVLAKHDENYMPSEVADSLRTADATLVGD